MIIFPFFQISGAFAISIPQHRKNDNYLIKSGMLGYGGTQMKTVLPIGETMATETPG